MTFTIENTGDVDGNEVSIAFCAASEAVIQSNRVQIVNSFRNVEYFRYHEHGRLAEAPGNSFFGSVFMALF